MTIRSRSMWLLVCAVLLFAAPAVRAEAPAADPALAVESSSLEWKAGYLAEQNAIGIPASARPELLWLVDPNDYLRPLVFDPADARWAKASRHDD